MSGRHLLYVDDVETQRVLFKDAIEEWNEANPEAEFTIEIKDSFEDGVAALGRTRFDGALFDLRLPAPDLGRAERPLGNELAQIGLHKFGIPVAIISGKPDEVDPDLAISSTVKVFDKGDGNAFVSAVSWFGTLRPMLETMSLARARIREASAGLFAERIWPSWQSYLSMADGKDLTPVLARQYVWHLGEVMGASSNNEEDLWHPLEAWICPPLYRDRASTGDILKQDDKLWVILTPPCDLANQGKIENVLLAHCSRILPADWDAVLEKCADSDPGRQRKGLDRIRKVFNQTEQALHYLPPLPDEHLPVTVEFSHLRTLSMPELQEILGSRVGSVTAPFVTNLTQRFGAYLSRVGQPNLNAQAFPQNGK